jgi:hypothetical protein
MGMVQGVMTLINGAIEMGSLAVEQEADAKAMAAKSREYQRASRAARQQEADALAKGSLESGKARQQGAEVVGEQRNAFASAGLDVNAGTAGQLQRSSEAYSELDAATARNNARREALGFRQYRGKLDDQAKADKDAFDARTAERPLRFMKSMLNSTSSAIGGK